MFFYLDRKILILDEALSAIDYQTRIEIIKNLKSLKNKIIIIVSHHIKTENNLLFSDVVNINDYKKKKKNDHQK
ncbi:hypothetical protein [Mesomycoplasma lagogenitalium]|uniref:ABC transporter ATP-binding protein n=1 Tax=Mesomycoplasma lagogenitalium TaxID=171286 RepID=A0ABY8LV50_9BACT|nr:hypothetical protein [Mesomycoplasma lagogenitalium]WGI36630.1 hypothetical protein QEG99_04165 [Mesomycoplasma lagogenitalium]